MCSDDEDSCCDCGLPPTVERRLLLTLVWSLIAFAYVSYYVVLIIPWNYHHSAWGIAHLLFFNVVVGLLVTSYWKAIFTNAGDVPRNYVPEYATEKELEAAKVKKNTKSQPFDPNIFNPERVRYCFDCGAFKPPRAHHCRDCKVCTLAMDHHCPWVGNCVGHKNHKFFLLFLIWSTVGLSYELLMFVWRFIDGMMYYSESMNAPTNGIAEYIGTPFSTTEVVLLCMNTFITLPVTIAIISLLFYQISCVLANQTSIEDYISGRQQSAARKAGVRAPSWAYDFGYVSNLRQKLGHNIWFWLIPIDTPVSDGFKWKSKPFRAPTVPEQNTHNSDPEARRAHRRIVESTV